jgi:hypothetical protein
MHRSRCFNDLVFPFRRIPVSTTGSTLKQHVDTHELLSAKSPWGNVSCGEEHQHQGIKVRVYEDLPSTERSCFQTTHHE